MGPWGALIMSFFGAGFFTWANVLAIGWRSPVLAVGPVMFIALAALAGSKIRRSADGAYAPSRKAGQIISWASAAEGVGIPIVALTLANTGHADATLPGVALVVGLHFIPMACAIPFKPFFACAALFGLRSGRGLHPSTTRRINGVWLRGRFHSVGGQHRGHKSKASRGLTIPYSDRLGSDEARSILAGSEPSRSSRERPEAGSSPDSAVGPELPKGFHARVRPKKTLA